MLGSIQYETNVGRTASRYELAHTTVIHNDKSTLMNSFIQDIAYIPSRIGETHLGFDDHRINTRIVDPTI